MALTPGMMVETKVKARGIHFRHEEPVEPLGRGAAINR
jgi:hypothetical protein